ncbi:MAG: DNA-processing protein DprA [Prevotellaceae bacterium]|nr:DNA-processing protein DprA [Prevotellaceae bacterium]
MNDEEILFSIALAKTFPLNSGVQNVLLDHFGSAKAVYDSRFDVEEALPGASVNFQRALAQMDLYLDLATRELDFAANEGVDCLCREDDRYPRRLRECGDAPIVIFYKGTADLNARHVVSMVGTRHCTEYGKTFCRNFMRDFARECPDAVVVSGLAYGIDIAAHREALEQGLPTMAVLAHGMEQIYPLPHKKTAEQMVSWGGLLTEYTSYSKINKVNFVSRNRIVAGLADAVIVVESRERGGSLITARLANEYNRDVFALPGRVSDEVSVGCNALIKEDKATLLESAADFVSRMGWETGQRRQPVQREIFPELTEKEAAIVGCLRGADYGKNVALLSVETNLPPQTLTVLLYDLETKGVVRLTGGGRYVLL